MRTERIAACGPIRSVCTLPTVAAAPVALALGAGFTDQGGRLLVAHVDRAKNGPALIHAVCALAWVNDPLRHETLDLGVAEPEPALKNVLGVLPQEG